MYFKNSLNSKFKNILDLHNNDNKEVKEIKHYDKYKYFGIKICF